MTCYAIRNPSVWVRAVEKAAEIKEEFLACKVSQFRHFCTVASGYRTLIFTPEMAACSVKQPQILLSSLNCRVNVLAFIMVELMLHVH